MCPVCHIQSRWQLNIIYGKHDAYFCFFNIFSNYHIMSGWVLSSSFVIYDFLSLSWIMSLHQLSSHPFDGLWRQYWHESVVMTFTWTLSLFLFWVFVFVSFSCQCLFLLFLLLTVLKVGSLSVKVCSAFSLIFRRSASAFLIKDVSWGCHLYPWHFNECFMNKLDF